MADVGSIGYRYGTEYKIELACDGMLKGDGDRPIVFRMPDYRWLWTVNYYTDTYLSGIVTDLDDDPLAGYPVALYYRSNRRLISQTVSAADGTFSFPNILDEAASYFMVCVDPNDTVNARIFDLLTPDEP